MLNYSENKAITAELEECDIVYLHTRISKLSLLVHVLLMLAFVHVLAAVALSRTGKINNYFALVLP